MTELRLTEYESGTIKAEPPAFIPVKMTQEKAMEGIREEKIMAGLPLPASRRMKTEAALESLLAWIPALGNRLLLACAVKLLLVAFGSLERSSGFLPGYSSDPEGKLLFFRDISANYQKILPYLLSLKLPFCGTRTGNRLVRYEEYLEDIERRYHGYPEF